MMSWTAEAIEVVGADPLLIATQLGLPVEIVRSLQERDVLVHFDLSDREARERLWEAQVRSARAKRHARRIAP
jgi:hypothetical protein